MMNFHMKRYSLNLSKLMNLFKEKIGLLKQNFNKKDIHILFVLLLIPNILRQIVYFTTFLRTGSYDFIASYETIQFYALGFPYVGVIEEVLIGLVFVSFWIMSSKLRFFAYGWLFDAFFDFVSVFVWSLTGATPLQALGLNHQARFFVREILFSYMIFGPLLWYKKVDIKKFSFFVTAFALLTILVVLLV